MSRLKTVQAFVDEARHLRRPSDLRALLACITMEMGFDYFALIHHVDLTGYSQALTHMEEGRLVALATYPESWVEQYIAGNIVANDPVLLASQRTNIGFCWSEIPELIPVTPAHIDIREQTIRAGIDDGFTVPAHVPGEANGSCNFAMATGRDLPGANLGMAQLVGGFAFQAARAMVVNACPDARLSDKGALTQRQLDCVLLAAKGKSDWEIGRILGISQGTVKRHIEAAREHYEVGSRMQVVMRVLFEGRIGLVDALR
ncbi:LuxR family transcriptional regulator [Parvularcula flava]|uniref:Transcriptional regulator n=1 Tax=Aquisalinus luteolus TaxID=1566827 RepID=A0A8J3EP57_9PROT|nr:LuxR family transcriptional regulator [Aquisalinus luteolus]NHK27173.1 LuxR family transcriptional regulator [Aquisalinus luteolus]GGH94618.1 transcriptional regulator [Aquisalinus luteolus]